MSSSSGSSRSSSRSASAHKKEDSWYSLVPEQFELVSSPSPVKRSVSSRSSAGMSSRSSSQSSIQSTSSLNSSAKRAKSDKQGVDPIAAIAAVSAANQSKTSVPQGDAYHLPAVDFQDSRDSGQFEDLPLTSAMTGGVTKEGYLFSTEDEGSEFRYSSSETDILLPQSEDGGDTLDGTDPGEDDGEARRDALHDAIAEVSADFVSGNLSVSLSQHTLETTSPHKESLKSEVTILDRVTEASHHDSTGSNTTGPELSQHLIPQDPNIPDLTQYSIPGQSAVDSPEHLLGESVSLPEHSMYQDSQLSTGVLGKSETGIERMVDQRDHDSTRSRDSPTRAKQSFLSPAPQDPGQLLNEESLSNFKDMTSINSDFIAVTDKKPKYTSTPYYPVQDDPITKIIPPSEKVGGSSKPVGAKTGIQKASSPGHSLTETDGTLSTTGTSSNKGESSRSTTGVWSEDSISPSLVAKSSSSLRGSHVQLPLDLNNLEPINLTPVVHAKPGSAHSLLASVEGPETLTMKSKGGSVKRNNSSSSSGSSSSTKPELTHSRTTKKLKQTSPAKKSPVTKLPAKTIDKKTQSSNSQKIKSTKNGESSTESDGSVKNSSASETSSTKIARSYIQYPHDLQSVTPDEMQPVNVNTKADSPSHYNVNETGTELIGDSQDLKDVYMPQTKTVEGRQETTVTRKSRQEELGAVVSLSSLDTVQSQDSLSRRVALLLSATSLPGEHHILKRTPSEDSGSFTSEAGSPDSIENILESSSSHRSRKVRSLGNQTPDSARTGSSESVGADSLADKVEQILNEPQTLPSVSPQSMHPRIPRGTSPTISDASTSSSVRAIIERVLHPTNGGEPIQLPERGYTQSPTAVSLTTWDAYTDQQTASLSKSMTIPLASSDSRDRSETTPQPTMQVGYDQFGSASSRQPQAGYRDGSSYISSDSLSRRVQQLLENTAYVERASAGADVARTPLIGDSTDLLQRNYNNSGSDTSSVSPTSLHSYQQQRVELDGTNSSQRSFGLGQAELSNGTTPRDPYGESIESMDSLASRVRAILAKNPPQEHVLRILQEAAVLDAELRLAEMQSQEQSSVSLATSHMSAEEVRKPSPMSQYAEPQEGQPFGALSYAQQLLASQLQRVTDRTFDHSVDYYKRPQPSVQHTETSLAGHHVNQPSKEAWTRDANTGPSQQLVYGLLPNQAKEPYYLHQEEEHQQLPEERQAGEDEDEEEFPSDDMGMHRSHSSPEIDLTKFRAKSYARQISERSQFTGSLERASRRRSREAKEKAKMTKRDLRPSPLVTQTSGSSRIPIPAREYQRSTSRESDQSRSPEKSPLQKSPQEFRQQNGQSVASSKHDRSRGSEKSPGSFIRPYKPPGSSEVMYTYPVNQEDSLTPSSKTTLESSHIGSDDALPPSFPVSAYGSRDSPKHIRSLELPGVDAEFRLHDHPQDNKQSPARSPRSPKSKIPMSKPDQRNRDRPARSYIEYPSDLKSVSPTERAFSGVESPKSVLRPEAFADYQQEKSTEFSQDQNVVARSRRVPKSQDKETESRSYGTYYDTTSMKQRYGFKAQNGVIKKSPTSKIPVRGAGASPEAALMSREMEHDVLEREDLTRRPQPSIGNQRHEDYSPARLPRLPTDQEVHVLPERSQYAARPGGLKQGGKMQYGSQMTDLPGTYSRQVLQEVLQDESDLHARDARTEMWDEYQEYKTRQRDESQSSLDSERIQRMASLMADPARHTVANWVKDETDSGGTSSSDTPRERKRWDKDRPYTPRKQPLEDDDRIEPPADGAYSPDELRPSTQVQTRADRPPTHIPKAVRRPVTMERRPPADPSSRRAPPQEALQHGDSSEELSIQSFISDLSLESDQLYNLLGEQGVRKLGSKLAKLQRKIDRQREHHRRRLKEHELPTQDEQKQKSAPVMASTPSSSAGENIEDDRKTLRPSIPPASVLSPVLETSHDLESSPGTSESTLTDQRQYYPKRMSSHRHKDDFCVAYSSSDVQSDALSEASVSCTCKPRFKRSRSLHDIHGVEEPHQPQDRLRDDVNQKRRRRDEESVKMRSRNNRESRLPTRIPAGTMTPAVKSSQIPQKKRGTAFTVEFGTQTTPGLKNKGGEKTTKQLGEAEGKESIFRQPRSSSEPSKGRRKIPQRVREAPVTPAVAWFQPISKKMPWQQAEPKQQRQPLRDRQPVAGQGSQGKPSLQEAFESNQTMFISRSRERQKKIKLAAEEREMQKQFDEERFKLFQDNRSKKVNPQAHPYSDQHHKPKKRLMSKKEMRQHTEKVYNKLPEVVQREKERKRQAANETNRIKALIYRKQLSDRLKSKPWTGP
ncbi:uncharacterized protein LOC117294586 isoform X1 [Asterias rubens]|uniref:uncharacterized protein LOC117294586 isoform X1 n=1 Tax=Asterias rubens TaxID=7604 RepID=UPI0014551958|nr:uncharacterized protein LOC117294586 isoform X1 [Asterias rubens]XP_033632955.1 uncharacterized protein LOC117294586 isoform X1 [Asterias rubens]